MKTLIERIQAEVWNTANTFEELFKEDEKCQTPLGRVEDILIRSIGVSERRQENYQTISPLLDIHKNMPELEGGIVGSREWLMLKALESVRDSFRATLGHIRVVQESMRYAREILDACSDE